jgi:NitT/TauT family transport system substrate-binding protein
VLGVAPIFVVDKEGWAKEAGFDLKFTTFESGPNMIQALASGTLDVYVAGVAPLGVARSKGIDIRVVTSTAVEEMTVAAGAKLAPSFKPGVAPAQALKDFRAATGKPARLATQPPGSVPHTTLVHWLTQVIKADKADYEIVPMGIDATQQALLTGAVDGATIREPTDTIVQQRDPRIKLVALGGEMFPNQPGTVVAFSGAFLTKNQAGVQKLVDALVKADKLIKADPKRVAPFVEAALGKGLIDAATIEKALTSPASKFTADPRVIMEATAKMQSFQVSIGTLEKDVPLDGLFDTSFYEKATAK